MVAHACNLGTLEAKQKDGILRPAWAISHLKKQNCSLSLSDKMLKSKYHATWRITSFLREKKGRRWGKTQESNKFCSGLALPCRNQGSLALEM